MTQPPHSPAGPPPVAAIRAALAALGDEASADATLDAAVGVLGRAADAHPEGLDVALSDDWRARGGKPFISTVADDWLAAAVIAGGRVVHSDAAFRAIRAAALNDLAARARAGARAYSALRLSDGHPAVAIAARGALCGNWPLGAAAREAAAKPGAVVVLTFAPSFSAELGETMARAFQFSRAEGRLAATLFEGVTVKEAAARLSIAPATARDQIRNLLRKTGASRRAGMMARMTELLAGDYVRAADRAQVLRAAFGLTAAEGRVAEAVSHGYTVPDIAARDGVSAHTVRAQLDTALSKTGVVRACDLARLVFDLCALTSWTGCSGPQRADRRALTIATRMIAAPGQRLIAAADYGPRDGKPLMVFHAGLSHRWIRRNLCAAFLERGLRPLSYDRADCGLTDSAEGGHVFDTAAGDAARVLSALKIDRTALFASFGGAGPALAFAHWFPDRVDDAVLLMPRLPQLEPNQPSGIQRIWRALGARPALAERFYERLRTGGGARFWLWFQAQVARTHARDRAAMKDPAYRDERIAELSAQAARSLSGSLALDAAYREGWTRPAHVGGRRWTVILTGHAAYRDQPAAEESWGWLPNVRFIALPDAGRLATHTHGAEIAAAFGD
jgi:DNA-binding CsgD family transcriptional regulator/pimeloyl-ACP methyl ester carboxylesterase